MITVTILVQFNLNCSPLFLDEIVATKTNSTIITVGKVLAFDPQTDELNTYIYEFFYEANPVCMTLKKDRFYWAPAEQWSLLKKWSFPLRISSVNVVKFAVSWGCTNYLYIQWMYKLFKVLTTPARPGEKSFIEPKRFMTQH